MPEQPCHPTIRSSNRSSQTLSAMSRLDHTHMKPLTLPSVCHPRGFLWTLRPRPEQEAQY
jgi:hypothetical protein